MQRVRNSDDVAHDLKFTGGGSAGETDSGRSDSGADNVSNRTLETYNGHDHCAPCPRWRGNAQNVYVLASGRSRRYLEDGQLTAMHATFASDPTVQLNATMVDIQSDLEWLNLGSNAVLELLYPENEQKEIEAVPLMKARISTLAETMKVPIGRLSILQELDEPETPPEIESVEDVPSLDGMDTPPELDEGYQTSESGLSAAEDLVTQFLNNFAAQIDIPDKHLEQISVAVAPNKCSSRFSWSSSVYSPTGDDKSEHEVWWRPIKPLNIKRKDEEHAPPVPDRNPLRLLRRLNKIAPQGYGETSDRKPRNILNLRLDLAESSGDDMKTPTQNPRSQRRRSYARESKSTPKQSLVDKTIKHAHLSHVVSAMRKPEQGTRAGAAWQSIHLGTKVRPRPKSFVREEPHRRSQSMKELSKPNKHIEELKAGRGHVRGASEPPNPSGRRRSRPINKWEDPMPPQGGFNKSRRGSLINGVRQRRPPPLPFNINKRLPALPSARETPDWQNVDDSDYEALGTSKRI